MFLCLYGFMKQARASFNFSDNPLILDMLRAQALQEGVSQKAVLIKALEAYFSHRPENTFVLQAANKIFTEWDNSDDAIYDTL